jgi:hypothetical protein
MTVSQLPAALQLSSLAGWNQTAEDWQLLLEVASDGCFYIAVGGVLERPQLYYGMVRGSAGLAWCLRTPTFASAALPSDC